MKEHYEHLYKIGTVVRYMSSTKDYNDILCCIYDDGDLDQILYDHEVAAIDSLSDFEREFFNVKDINPAI